MMTRCVFSFLMMALVIGSLSSAGAQPAHPDHRYMVSEHTVVNRLAGLITNTFRPVEIRKVDAPEQVVVGEASSFEVIANVESASLPLRAVWRLEDGTVKRGLSIEHVFERPGLYEVEVELANRRSSDSRTFTIEVSDTEQRS